METLGARATMPQPTADQLFMANLSTEQPEPTQRVLRDVDTGGQTDQRNTASRQPLNA
jgi:hypothetical protein